MKGSFNLLYAATLFVESAGKPMLDQYSSGVKPQRSSQSDDWRAGNSEETVFVQSYDVKKIIGKIVLS